jgi:L-malate glycosyltransferase
MRVLHVIDNLSPGGTERQCLDLVRSMTARGVDTAVLYARGGALLGEFERTGATVQAAPAVSFRSPRAVVGVGQLARMIARWAPDVVQTYGFYSDLPGLPAAFLARVRVRVAGRRDLGSALSPSQRAANRWTWKLAHRIVVNSEAVREDVFRRDQVARDKVVVIRNGVDLRRWMTAAPGAGDAVPAVVGMVAHFRPQKDHVMFLRAAQEVRKAMPSVRFCLVGAGPLESTIREAAERSGLGPHVDFLVGLEGDAVRAAMSRFRVSVLSSKDNEGLPNTVLESMAIGLPVVATAVGGTPEVVEEGETGFLVPAGDAAGLASRIVRLLQEPERARAMGERARKKIACQFSLERMGDQFLELYRTLLGRARVAPVPAG